MDSSTVQKFSGKNLYIVDRMGKEFTYSGEYILVDGTFEEKVALYIVSYDETRDEVIVVGSNRRLRQVCMLRIPFDGILSSINSKDSFIPIK